MRGLVPYWRELRYSGKDPDGHSNERLTQDFHVRVVQH
jgi:peptide deformylase